MHTQFNPRPRPRARITNPLPHRQSGDISHSSHRRLLEERLGDQFGRIAKQFTNDGVLIIQGLIDREDLRELRDFFAQCVVTKPLDQLVQQVSFSGPADWLSFDNSPAVRRVVYNPLLTALAEYYLGSPVCLAFWRGYRLLPRPPILYRAWDWHNDQKRAEIKAMVLLSDVPPGGQAMEYIKGSHVHWWQIETQADTKYSMQEALSLGRGVVTRCTGIAGTVILFDTNGIHRGTRSLHATRDILAFNYVENAECSPAFPLPNQSSYPGSQSIEEAHLSMPLQTTLRRLTVVGTENDSALKDADQLTREYARTPRFAHQRNRYACGTSFREHIKSQLREDLHNDLDLPIRPHNSDVSRDIALVSLRDGKDWNSQSFAVEQDIDSFIPPAPVPHAPDLDMECLEQVVIRIRQAASQLAQIQRWGVDPTIQGMGAHYVAFASDLAAAIGWTDTVDRLRTNLSFAIALTTGLCTEAGRGPGTTVQIDRLLHARKILIEDYASVVATDDLDECVASSHDLQHRSV